MDGKKSSLLSLSELLVVVAIVGVLSAVLLPAFAAARDRAREAVCLANVRTVAAAVRMYLADNDGRFPPQESDPAVFAYFDSGPGGSADREWDPDWPEPHCERAMLANPYLRYPVLLDDYLLSREVWRCPNAFLESGASFIHGMPDWLGHLKAHEGRWGARSAPYLCAELGWPVGWGGEVTDSITQRRLAVPRGGKGRKASPGAFVRSIGTSLQGSFVGREASVGDPGWFVVCADAGAVGHDMCAGTLAYPDLCRLECATAEPGAPDEEYCPWSPECAATVEMMNNPAARQPYARHFGGANIGFLDGHAQWFHSEEVIAESPSWSNPQRGQLRGYFSWGPRKDAPGYDPADGIPALY